MRNPSEDSIFLASLFAGWAFGWFSASRWLLSQRDAGRFVAHVVGFVCGFFTGVSATILVGVVALSKGSVEDTAGPLLVLGLFLYAWWSSRSFTIVPHRLAFDPQSETKLHTYLFKYQSTNGDARVRRVRVQGRAKSGHAKYFVGICLEADAERTFRLDRIISNMTDEDSGELRTPEDIFAECKTECSVQLDSSSFSEPTDSIKNTWVTAIYIAGFRGSKYDELERIALAAGWDVRIHISPSVDYVLANGQAGAKQLEKAASLGIPVIDEYTFRSVVSSS